MLKFCLLVVCLHLPFLMLGQSHEICGDGIDNDNDGRIDEVCSPFECDGTLYQSASSNGDFVLYKVNANPVQFYPISNLTQRGITSSFNSLAYNPVDNLMYGMGVNDSKIYRIDAHGDVEYLGNVTGLSSFKNAGTFDAMGNYYVFGNNELKKININTLTYTVIGGRGAYGSADIVFNPADNQIYGWFGSSKLLFKINPNTGVQTKVPGTAPLAVNSSWGWIGALYFNAQGDILGYQGTKMIKIDPTTGIGVLTGTGANKSGNDGCSCSFGVEMTKAVSGTYTEGDTITYDFEFFNQSFSHINNSVVFEDLLTGGFQWVSNPYNITNLSLAASPNLIGKDSAIFTISHLPKGKSSFSIDVVIPCGYSQNSYTNQAILHNLPSPLKDTIWSDNPNTLAIGDATTIRVTANPLTLTTTVNNIICERNIGTIKVNAVGGALPLRYSWNNGQIGDEATQLGAGTYTVLVRGATGCVDSTRATVKREIIAITTLLNPQNVQCFGGSNGRVNIEGSTGGYPPYRYSLDGNTYGTGLVFEDLAAGAYTIYARDSFGCRGQQNFRISTPAFILDITAPNDTLLLLGEKMTPIIRKNTLTPVSYEWTPSTGLSCTNCPSPTIRAEETTTYFIKGKDILGCSDSTSFTVEVDEDTRYFVPNAFSPNNDGNNDFLMIYSPGDVELVKSFRVFDRWGELLFERANFLPNYAANGWDGTYKGQIMNTGVYVFVAELELVNGQAKIISGDVTLLR